MMDISKLQSVTKLLITAKSCEPYAKGDNEVKITLTQLKEFRQLAIKDFVKSLEPSPVVKQTLGVELYDLSEYKE